MGNTDMTMLTEALPAFERWMLTRLQQGIYHGWCVVTAEQQIVASAGLWLLDWPPGALDQSPYRGYILNVYTEPTFRRQGLAQQLIETILTWCREQGIYTISLHTSDQGLHIYESLGFEQTNEMRLRLHR